MRLGQTIEDVLDSAGQSRNNDLSLRYAFSRGVGELLEQGASHAKKRRVQTDEPGAESGINSGTKFGDFAKRH